MEKEKKDPQVQADLLLLNKLNGEEAQYEKLYKSICYAQGMEQRNYKKVRRNYYLNNSKDIKQRAKERADKKADEVSAYKKEYRRGRPKYFKYYFSIRDNFERLGRCFCRILSAISGRLDKNCIICGKFFIDGTRKGLTCRSLNCIKRRGNDKRNERRRIYGRKKIS